MTAMSADCDALANFESLPCGHLCADFHKHNNYLRLDSLKIVLRSFASEAQRMFVCSIGSLVGAISNGEKLGRRFVIYVYNNF